MSSMVPKKLSLIKKDRRSALRKIGKYSAYALPALLAMSARAAIGSGT